MHSARECKNQEVFSFFCQHGHDEMRVEEEEEKFRDGMGLKMGLVLLACVKSETLRKLINNRQIQKA